MTSPPSLFRMLTDLSEHPDLSAEDRQMLRPGFDAVRTHEVVALPELIVGHVGRLHARLVTKEQ